MYKKINITIGVLLLITVFVLNEWTLNRFFSSDGHIQDPLNRSLIYLFDFFFGFLGIFLIRKSETFRFKIKSAILPCLVSLGVFMIVMELYAKKKCLYSPPSLAVQILHEELGDKASDFIDPAPPKAGLKYYEYHLFANAPYHSKTATFTEYFSARRVPDSYPLGQGDIIVWLFGGSTMQNLETVDKFTIANSIALDLKESGIKATVVNFGVGSFQSSLESIKFQDLLRRVSPSEKPDFVIFYDGYNDAAYTYLSGPGNIQKDLSGKMELLITSSNQKLFIYSASNFLDKQFYFWKYYVKPRIDTMLFASYKFCDSKEDMVKGVEMYILNTKIIRGICKELGIKPFFVLQPMIYTKKNLTAFEISAKAQMSQPLMKFMEEFYNIVKEKMKFYDDFYDLTSVLDKSKRNDFFDYGHTGPYTGVGIGKHIAQFIKEAGLDKSKKSRTADKFGKKLELPKVLSN